MGSTTRPIDRRQALGACVLAGLGVGATLVLAGDQLPTIGALVTGVAVAGCLVTGARHLLAGARLGTGALPTDEAASISGQVLQGCGLLWLAAVLLIWASGVTLPLDQMLLAFILVMHAGERRERRARAPHALG